MEQTRPGEALSRLKAHKDEALENEDTFYSNVKMKGNLDMNFDTVQTWKNENDQLELQDAELERIYGGGGGFGPGFGGGLPPVGGPVGGPVVAPVPVGGAGAGAVASHSLASSQRIHSFSVVCDINIFSINAVIIPIINIANCLNQICANSD